MLAKVLKTLMVGYMIIYCPIIICIIGAALTKKSVSKETWFMIFLFLMIVSLALYFWYSNRQANSITNELKKW